MKKTNFLIEGNIKNNTPRSHGKITGMTKQLGFIESVFIPAFFTALGYTVLLMVAKYFLLK